MKHWRSERELIKNFKDKIVDNGHEFSWFHEKYIEKYGLDYVDFLRFLNWDETVIKPIEFGIYEYMRDYGQVHKSGN